MIFACLGDARRRRGRESAIWGLPPRLPRDRKASSVADPDLDSNPDSNPDPKLDPKKICKKEHYFQAEISWFHMIIHISHLQNSSNNRCTVETGSCAQCCGSVTIWYGSGSADPCLLLMDPNPNPANLLRTLFVAKSWSWGKAAFLFLKMRLGKNFRTKKEVLASVWSRSESRIRIRIRIRDSNPKLTLGRIRIRDQIRTLCFGSATL